MDRAKLAAAIMRAPDAPKSAPFPRCVSCGATFVAKKPREDINNWSFCSERCAAWYDAGNPRAADQTPPDLYGTRGWIVFASPLGTKIGKPYPPYEKINAISDGRRAALAGKDLIRPRRLCEKCGDRIPVWQNGKLVPSNRKFCNACKNGPSGAKSRKRRRSPVSPR